MKDQQKQAFRCFERKCPPYLVTIRLTKEEAVEILAENTLTFEKYRKIIDKEQLSSNESCKYFDEPFELLESIHNNFHDLVVNEEAIGIQYVSGMMRKVIKNVSFKLEQIQVNPAFYVQAQLSKMRDQLSQKQEIIAKLNGQKSQLEQQLEKSKHACRQLEQKWKQVSLKHHEQTVKNDLISEQIAKMMVSSKQMTQKLQTNERKLLKMEEQAVHLKQQSNFLVQEIIQLKKRLYAMVHDQAPKIHNCVSHHPLNAHLKFYELVHITQTSVRIIRRGESEKYYNFMNYFDVYFRSSYCMINHNEHQQNYTPSFQYPLQDKAN